MVAASGLGRRFAGRWVLRGIDLELARGESLLVFGANGSGKTTLLRVLASALSPSAGRLALFGGPPVEARPRVGLLSHADGHYDDLSGRDNLDLARNLGHLAGDVGSVLDRVGLAGRADDAVRHYSAGMRKRLAFARLLLKAPPLVLLDEPYAALDPAGHAFVDSLLAELRAAGVTTVVSTHMVARVAARCDRALELAAGRSAWWGASAELTTRLRVTPERDPAGEAQVSGSGSAGPTGAAT